VAGARLDLPQGTLDLLIRKPKYYGLTRAGRKQLAGATGDWARLTGAVNVVLGME
jgi:hypothetical protein